MPGGMNMDGLLLQAHSSRWRSERRAGGGWGGRGRGGGGERERDKRGRDVREKNIFSDNFFQESFRKMLGKNPEKYQGKKGQDENVTR